MESVIHIGNKKKILLAVNIPKVTGIYDLSSVEQNSESNANIALPLKNQYDFLVLSTWSGYRVSWLSVGLSQQTGPRWRRSTIRCPAGDLYATLFKLECSSLLAICHKLSTSPTERTRTTPKGSRDGLGLANLCPHSPRSNIVWKLPPVDPVC